MYHFTVTKQILLLEIINNAIFNFKFLNIFIIINILIIVLN